MLAGAPGLRSGSSAGKCLERPQDSGGGNAAEPVLATSTATSSSGFDWSDALVGAGSALALVLFTGAAMVLVRRRSAARVQPTI